MNFAIFACFAALAFAQDNAYYNMFIGFYTDSDCLSADSELELIGVFQKDGGECQAMDEDLYMIATNDNDNISMQWFEDDACTIAIPRDSSGDLRRRLEVFYLPNVFYEDAGTCSPYDGGFEKIDVFYGGEFLLTGGVYDDDQCTAAQDDNLVFAFDYGACSQLDDFFFKINCAASGAKLELTVHDGDGTCGKSSQVATLPVNECLESEQWIEDPRVYEIYRATGAVCECTSLSNDRWNDDRCQNRCMTGENDERNEDRCDKHCSSGCVDVDHSSKTCHSTGSAGSRGRIWSRRTCRKRCHFPDDEGSVKCDDKCTGCKWNTETTTAEPEGELVDRRSLGEARKGGLFNLLKNRDSHKARWKARS